MEHPLLVISLKRTPERLKAFYDFNKNSLVDWKVDVIHGIDGFGQEQINQQSRWVSASAREHWTKGAIGSALSHIKAWRRCIELNQEVIIVEDDTILAMNLKSKLEDLKLIGNAANHSSFVLLGWNTDSVLQAELLPGLEMISLFEPIYPNHQQIEQIINSDRKPHLCNLNVCFGLPAYWINPKTANELLDTCMPLKTENNNMTRGIPQHFLVTLDGMLTNRYKEINAKVTIPPLALALNDQSTSLTKNQNICNFGG
tara:strand:+ start:1471 stop:2241 length:771 start_codon:yes stop_codon:yes gene_type:complete